MTFFQGQTQDERFASSPGAVANEGMARRIKLVQDAAPIFGQGEGVKYAAQWASSALTDDEIIQQAQAGASTILIDGYKSHLATIEDPWKQLQAWKQFDEGTQRLLKKSGYVPPVDAKKPPSESPLGLLGDIVGEVADAAVWDWIGVSKGLKGLDYIGQLPSRVYQMGRLGIEEEGFLGMGGSLTDAEIQERRGTPLAVLQDMRNLWNRTAQGEKLFSVKSQERVRKTIQEPDKFNFVMSLAEGNSVFDYLKDDLKLDPESPYFEQQLMKYTQYQEEEPIENAIKELRNNKYSPGRDIASGLGLERTGDVVSPFGIVSGGIDAVFRVVADPTLVGGKAYKTARLARLGISGDLLQGGTQAANLARRIDYLKTVPQHMRAADEISAAIRSGNEARLLDRLPQMRGGGLVSLNDWLVTQGPKLGITRETFTSEHVFDYFKSEMGTLALRRGQFAAPHFPGTILPSMTKKQEFAVGMIEEAKGWVGKFRLEDYGFDALDDVQLKELFGLRGKAGIDLRQGVGNAIHSFYAKIPKYQFMSPDDDNSLEQFRAVLDYSLPGFLRDDYVNEFLHASDTSVRRSIYESGVKSMFHYSGALGTDEGQKLMDTVLNRAHAFAADAVDLHDGKPIGIGEADLAEFWGVPDFKEMLKVTAKTTHFRKVMDRTNDGLINRFFADYWKPAVLLKAGFIPRAYGEEFLNFVMREGPSAWFKSQAAISATKEGYALPLRPIGWLADSLLSHIPITSISDPLQVFAHNVVASMDLGFKNFAERLAPDKYLAAMRSAAENGGGLQGAMGELGVMYGEVAPGVGDRLKNELIGRIDPVTGDLAYVPIRHGEVTMHKKGASAFHAHTVLREMRRMQTDRLYRPIIDASRRQLVQTEVDEIVGRFGELGFEVQSGTRGLLDIRRLIPNKVMNKFEKYLKNSSFASRDSVIAELAENGMDAQTADRLMEAIDQMPPRQRVAILTRDGELERIYQPQTLDPDAPFDAQSSLPYTRQAIEDELSQEYEDILMTLWDENAPSREAYGKIASRRLKSNDMQDTVNKSYRSQANREGQRVAAPPVKGHRRIYTIIADSNRSPELMPVANTDSAANLAPRLATGDEGMGTGWTPFQSGEINQLVPNYEPNLTPQVISGGEQVVPEEMAWFTSDLSHVTAVHNKLARKHKKLGVTIGYVDVPTSVYDEGRVLAKSNAGGGLDPMALQNQANQVWIPKTYRDNYTALTDDYKMVPGPDGDVAAVGITRDEALDDWADVIRQRVQQVFEANDSFALRDLSHNLIDGRVTTLDVANNTQHLNDFAIGPAILEPEKENWLKKITQRGFDIVGQGGNAMIRNQMYLHYYAKHLDNETKRLANVLGETGATATINEFSDRLGVSHYQLVQDWKSLPDDVRGAANPFEAAIARDPVPPSLRVITDPEDQKQLAEAFTALYEHDNPDLIDAAEKMWRDKYVRTGLAPEDVNFNMLQDSYIGLDDELRESILHNGYPPDLPHSFTPHTTTKDVELVEGLRKDEYAFEKHTIPSEEGPALPKDLDFPKGEPRSITYNSGVEGPDTFGHEFVHYGPDGTADGYLIVIMGDNPNWVPDIRVAVNPEARRQGIATSLYKEAEKAGIDIEAISGKRDLTPEGAAFKFGRSPKQIAKEEIRVAGAASLSADDWTKLRDALETNKHLYKTAHDVAMRAAINETIPWIDDYRVRSQFQQHGRNLIPFWFSQENFYKRIANSVLRDPAAIRKAQIGMDALQNSGFISQNQFGEDVYNIPLTGPLLKTITKIADVLPGDWSIPVTNPMTGQLKYTIPGLDSFDRIGPSVSPLMALPLQTVAGVFPELEGAKQAVLGERGAKNDTGWDMIIRSIMPSWAHKVYEGMAKDWNPDLESEYASAMIQTAQMLEESGNGLPEDADEYEHDKYMSKLENFSRMQIIVRGLVGFFSPAAPSTAPVEEFSPEFKELLKDMPLDQAMMSYMAKFPDAKAYTVMKTDVPSKANFSASEEAGVVLDNHSDFFDRNPTAGPWFLPQSQDDTGFSTKVYNTEIARGLRERKSVKEWYDDYYFAAAADDYFDTKEGHELRMAGAKGNSQLRQQYTDQYKTWKTDYLDKHKIFARLLVDPTSQIRRREVLDNIDAAFADPGRPKIAHEEPLKDLVDTYKGHIARKDAYNRNTSAHRQIKQTMDDQFTVWVKQHVDKNPSIRAFYNRIVRPELGIEE